MQFVSRNIVTRDDATSYLPSPPLHQAGPATIVGKRIAKCRRPASRGRSDQPYSACAGPLNERNRKAKALPFIFRAMGGAKQNGIFKHGCAACRLVVSPMDVAHHA